MSNLLKSTRRGGNERNSRTTHPQKAYRRTSAAEQSAARAERTDEEQLALLDLRPGNSSKERARLEASIEECATQAAAAAAKKQREKDAKEAR